MALGSSLPGNQGSPRFQESARKGRTEPERRKEREREQCEARWRLLRGTKKEQMVADGKVPVVLYMYFVLLNDFKFEYVDHQLKLP